jgi:putative transcriptional regulator
MAHHGEVPRPGQLLIAAPTLPVPFFRAVIYVIEHDEAGALGVVLNDPATLDVGDVLPQWRSAVTGEPVVFAGGPVAQDSALALAAVDADEATQPPAFRRVSGPIGLIDLDADVHTVGDQVTRLRIFAGYAGWSPGQLDGEIADGSWAVIDPVEPTHEVFVGDEGSQQWRRLLRAQPGTLAWWANCPADPSWN